MRSSVLMGNLRWERPRFTLRDWIAFLAGLAAGFADLRRGLWSGLNSWSEALVAAVSVWFAFGLSHQARDLWRDYRKLDLALTEDRWGWRFAMSWRSALAILLVGFHATTWFSLPGLGHKDAVMYLSLIVVLSSVPAIAQRRLVRQSIAQATINVVVATVLGLILLPWELTTECLTYIAGLAIEVALKDPLEVTSSNLIARARPLFWTGAAGLVLSLLNLLLTSLLARGWTRGWRYRLPCGGLLTASLAATVALSIWWYVCALPTASPFMAGLKLGAQDDFEPTWFSRGLDFWLVVSLLMLMASASAAYRLVAVPDRPSDHMAGGQAVRDVASSRSTVAESRYYHERRGVLLLLAGAVLADILYAAYRSLGWSWKSFFEGYSSYEAWFTLAILFLALEGAFAGGVRGGGSRAAATAPARLHMPSFLTIWLAMLATMASGIPAIAIFCFVVWLYPWFL